MPSVNQIEVGEPQWHPPVPHSDPNIALMTTVFTHLSPNTISIERFTLFASSEPSYLIAGSILSSYKRTAPLFKVR